MTSISASCKFQMGRKLQRRTLKGKDITYTQQFERVRLTWCHYRGLEQNKMIEICDLAIRCPLSATAQQTRNVSNCTQGRSCHVARDAAPLMRFYILSFTDPRFRWRKIHSSISLPINFLQSDGSHPTIADTATLKMLLYDSFFTGEFCLHPPRTTNDERRLDLLQPHSFLHENLPALPALPSNDITCFIK